MKPLLQSHFNLKNFSHLNLFVKTQLHSFLGFCGFQWCGFHLCVFSKMLFLLYKLRNVFLVTNDLSAADLEMRIFAGPKKRTSQAPGVNNFTIFTRLWILDQSKCF